MNDFEAVSVPGSVPTLEDCIVDHYLAYLDRLKTKLPTDIAYSVAAQLLIARKLHDIGDKFELEELEIEHVIPEGRLDEWIVPSLEDFNMGDK
jgi:hypothetical protein